MVASFTSWTMPSRRAKRGRKSRQITDEEERIFINNVDGKRYINSNSLLPARPLEAAPAPKIKVEKPIIKQEPAEAEKCSISNSGVIFSIAHLYVNEEKSDECGETDVLGPRSRSSTETVIAGDVPNEVRFCEAAGLTDLKREPRSRSSSTETVVADVVPKPVEVPDDCTASGETAGYRNLKREPRSRSCSTETVLNEEVSKKMKPDENSSAGDAGGTVGEICYSENDDTSSILSRIVDVVKNVCVQFENPSVPLSNPADISPSCSRNSPFLNEIQTLFFNLNSIISSDVKESLKFAKQKYPVKKKFGSFFKNGSFETQSCAVKTIKTSPETLQKLLERSIISDNISPLPNNSPIENQSALPSQANIIPIKQEPLSDFAPSTASNEITNKESSVLSSTILPLRSIISDNISPLPNNSPIENQFALPSQANIIPIKQEPLSDFAPSTASNEITNKESYVLSSTILPIRSIISDNISPLPNNSPIENQSALPSQANIIPIKQEPLSDFAPSTASNEITNKESFVLSSIASQVSTKRKSLFEETVLVKKIKTEPVDE